MRKAFTLIELLISIVIVTILMVFIYKSYASLNRSNDIVTAEVQKLQKFQKIKKTLFLDLLQAKQGSVKILNQEKNNDVVFLQTTNSLHHRFNPYVAYILKDKYLYRLESLREFKEYPLGVDDQFIVDKLIPVKLFRLYPPRDKKQSAFVLHAIFENEGEVILKIPQLETLF